MTQPTRIAIADDHALFREGVEVLLHRLADTVFDKDHSDRPLDQRNGYRFDNYDVPGLESALIRAIDCYYQYPEHFRELMKNAMRADYSWNHPGQDYLNIYDFIRNR